MRSETRLAVLAIFVVLMAILNFPAWDWGVPANEPSAGAPAAGNLLAAAQPNSPPFEFFGKIEAINGNLWVVSGRAFAVGPQAVGGVPFRVGDTVRLVGSVAKTGLVLVTGVEIANPPAPLVFGYAGRPMGLNSSNSSSHKSYPYSYSGSMNGSYEDEEMYGTVEAINGDQITIDGVTYTLSQDLDYGYIAVGDKVEFEFFTNADGSKTITDIETSSGMNDEDSYSNSNSSYNGSCDDDEDSHSNSNSSNNGSCDDEDDD